MLEEKTGIKNSPMWNIKKTQIIKDIYQIINLFFLIQFFKLGCINCFIIKFHKAFT